MFRLLRIPDDALRAGQDSNNPHAGMEYGGLQGVLGSSHIPARNWQEVVAVWSQSPGKIKQEQCDRAIRMIKQAIERDRTLQTKTIRTFSQGSYRNHPNVRQDSDVNVCVLCEEMFSIGLLPGVSATDIEGANQPSSRPQSRKTATMQSRTQSLTPQLSALWETKSRIGISMPNTSAGSGNVWNRSRCC